jgi:hypothetical protein
MNQDSTQHSAQASTHDSVLIDCNDCVLHDSAACADCVVTFICRTDATSPVVVDLAEVRAIKLFDAAGLVPPLRHRTGPDLTGPDRTGTDRTGM